MLGIYLTATLLVLAFLLRGFRTRVVQDYERALLIRNGITRREVRAGVHRLFHPRCRLEVFDLREQALVLATQEVTSKDQVPFKVNASITYALVDLRVARERAADVRAELYSRVQGAVREVAGQLELEELLTDRTRAHQAFEGALQGAATDLGIEVRRAVWMDVIVRSELKRALSDVVRARAEARAKLERARGESAALRNLANASRLLREHEGLYELRLLEAAQKAAEGEANSLVLGLQENGLAAARRKDR